MERCGWCDAENARCYSDFPICDRCFPLVGYLEGWIRYLIKDHTPLEGRKAMLEDWLSEKKWHESMEREQS